MTKTQRDKRQSKEVKLWLVNREHRWAPYFSRGLQHRKWQKYEDTHPTRLIGKVYYDQNPVVYLKWGRRRGSNWK